MNRKVFAAVFVLLLVGVVAVPKAKADNRGDVLFIVKGGPVDLPGHVLMPGKYEIQFQDSENNLVAIRKAGSGDAIGMFIVQPEYSPNAAGKTKVELSEVTKTAPERMLGFYDSRLGSGFDFIYPHSPAATRATMASGLVNR